MAKYLFIYHGGTMPETEEEGKNLMSAWGHWLETHKHAFVDQGNPVGKSHSVDAKGMREGADNPAAGYSIVVANNLDEANIIAAASPQVQIGGSVEVAEIMPI